MLRNQQPNTESTMTATDTTSKTTRRPPRYRVTGDRQTCSVTIYDPPYGDGPETRYYWRPLRGGYVYDVTDRPGTTGQQVCDRMASLGSTLYCGESQDLTALIRREMRRRMASEEG
jgi:hypothetical protein